MNSIWNDERIQADAEACYDEQHGVRSNDDIAAIARCLRRMRDEYEQRIADLVEAAKAIDRLNDDWDFSSMLDEPVEYGFIIRDSFARLRAALDAAKGG